MKRWSAEAVRELLSLHSPRPVSPRQPDVLQCSHCADLCHSRSGLGCELEGDALYPCETVETLRSAGLYTEVDEP